MTQVVVIVEGESDRRCLEALARHPDVHLDLTRVRFAVAGGATNVATHLERQLAYTPHAAFFGLCDSNEAEFFEQEELFDQVFVCVADLEDELLRAVGHERMLEFIEAQGELGAFRTFQKQPPWREQELRLQLRRFWGTKARRKTRYAQDLVSWIADGALPTPLFALVNAVADELGAPLT